MNGSDAKFQSYPYGGDNSHINRRSSFGMPNGSPKLSRPHLNRQMSRSAPGSRRGSPSAIDRSGFMNRRDMDQLQVAFKRAYYKGSPRSSDRSNRLPRNGDLGIISPYGFPNKAVPHDSNDTLYKEGRQGYFGQYPAGIYDWDNDEPPKEPKTFQGVLTRFGSYTSLQGVPFILRGKRWYSRLLWTFLFLVALGLTTWQFYEVIQKYLAKDTSSSIKLGYANLEFPSVTICNINPIRTTELNDTSRQLRSFLKTINPPQDYNQAGPGIGVFRPSGQQQLLSRQGQQQSEQGQQQSGQGQQQSGQSQQQSGQGQQQSGQGGQQQSGQGQQQSGQSQQQTRQGQQQSGQGGQQQSGQGQQQSGEQGTSGGRKKRQTENTTDSEGDVNFDKHRPPPGGDDFGQGNASAKFVYDQVFYNLVADLNRKTRRDVGHQRDVLILNCEFNGRQCRDKHWQHSLSREYGNCYTFNNADRLDKPLRSQRAGSQYGLNLILYIEEHEYLKGIVHGLGARFAIHPYKTLPFVAENGLSVATGTETFVGIKLINIERIGTCGDNGEFENEYGKSYTVEACVATCLDRVHIAGKCKCYRPENYNYYSKKAIDSMRPCTTAQDEACIYKWIEKDASGDVKCQCREECAGVSYDMTPSYNHWPDVSLWFTLVDAVCEQSENSCNYLKQIPNAMRKEVLRDNFIALRIYYRDLNFESIEEELVYEDSQFVADLGGTAGLWVGASVLTIMEVIDLLIQVVLFPCKKRKSVKERRPPKTKL